MKILLRVVVGLVVLTVAVVVAGVAIVASLDPNEYREQISAEAKAATGRELNLKGDLGVGISLIPTIIANDVTFANASWGSRPEMASIKRMEATLEILPLLSGEVRIRKIVLVEPDILFEVSSDGRPNWDFANAAANPPAAAQGSSLADKSSATAETSAPATFPTVDSLTIDRGKFRLNDMKAKTELSLSLDRVRIDDPGAGAKLKIDISGAYNETPFQIKGTTDSVDRLMADARNYSIDLEAVAMEATAKIKGTIGTPMSTPRLGLDFSLTGKDLAATLKAAKSLAPQLGDVVLPEIGSYDLSGKATGLVSAPAIENLKIALGNTDAFKLNGAGKATPENLTLDSFDLGIYGSDLSGNLSAALGGAVPRITAALLSRNLDLADIRKFLGDAKDEKPAALSSAPAPSSKSAAQAGEGRVFPADPLPFDKLKGIEAQVSFKGNHVVAEGTTLNDVDVNATLANGKLNLDPFGATISEGRVSGKIAIDAAAAIPVVTSDVTVQKLNLGKLLKERDVTDILAGSASAKVKAQASGNSVRALMANLTGDTEVIMDEGRLANGYVDMLAADLFKQILPGSNAGDVQINCFVSRFDIKQGMATSKALLLDTGRMTVSGGGTVDLGAEQLKLGLDPRPKDNSLISLAVPLEVSGPFTAPRVAPTTTAVLKGIAGFAITGLTPVGILAALARAGTGDENPCLAALKGAPAEQQAPAKPGQEPATAPPENKSVLPIDPAGLLRGLLGGKK